MRPDESHDSHPKAKHSSTLRHVIWRGISIIAPPLVTLLLLIWLLNAIEQYVLLPLETGIRNVVVATTADIVDRAPAGSKPIEAANPAKGFTFKGITYVQPPLGRRYLPVYVVESVNDNIDRLPRGMQRPMSAHDFYAAYVRLHYMPRSFTIPLLLLVVLSSLFSSGDSSRPESGGLSSTLSRARSPSCL